MVERLLLAATLLSGIEWVEYAGKIWHIKCLPLSDETRIEFFGSLPEYEFDLEGWEF